MTDPMRNSDQSIDWPLFAAWLVALGSTGGALFIGEVLGQAPCDLCWFQRAFMFPLAVVLGIAALRGDRAITPYALALTGFGGAIAAFHTFRYFDVIPEAIRPCTATGPSCSGAGMAVVGVPIPLLSLVAFAAVTVLLLVPRTKAIR